MPKNAVQRLQKIEKDIKTVISIFEISTQPKHGKIETSEKHFTQLPENGTPECSKTSLSIDKLREVPHHTQNSLCESPEKNGNFSPRPPKANHSRESLVTIHMKPNSPPSSRSMITMRESKMWQKQTDKENSGLSSAKTFYNVKRLDLSNSDKPVYNVVMTPSKTLQTASEILQKNNFDNSQKNELPSKQSALKPEGTDKVKNSEKEKTKPRKRDPEHSTQSVRCGILKSKGEENYRGTRLLLVRKNEHPGQDVKHVGDHMVMDTSPAFYIEPRKTKIIQKMMNENGRAQKNKMNTTPEENFSNDSTGDKKRQNFQENEKKVVFSYTTTTPFNQKIPTSEESEETELWTSELYKKIERSNEKLEKMKIFKELALEIAKHLKNKYDDIQKSKEELVVKLQKLEKHNEKLNLEVKEANETKKKLQQKIEGFMITKTNSEDDIKPQGNDKEDDQFKSKIIKLQKQLSSEIYENQQSIDKIQIERCQENRSDVTTREILTDELQRVTEEKTDLLLKLNLFESLVEERDCQIEKLHYHIQELEKEVQNQNQNLRTKTDAHQQTNEELYTLRQKFVEVENEVYGFKTKIENLETFHSDLINKISEYEGQLKSNQKEINDLKELNKELGTQLESEKDGLRIKNKIIDDQQETIKQLKEKSEDVKNILKRNESLERILNIEREEKLELQEAVERLKRRKDELKTKIKGLENDIQFAPQEVLEDLKKTQAVLQELESQVQLKQNEWTMEQQLLLQAKEQACNVAEFATKKLMETTSELQRQSQAYKCLQRMIAEDLAMRKRQMRAENKKDRYQQLQGTLEPDITFPTKSDS